MFRSSPPLLSMDDSEVAKQAAGYHAASLVSDGMCLGLGTGSTTAYAFEGLGQRIREEDLDVRGVPTSYEAERRAREHGIPLTTLDTDSELDLAFDGADEVDEDRRLIKGRGGAHAREKVVAYQAERFVVLIDPSKQVDQLGTNFPVPVEILPMATTPVAHTLEEMGATPELRTGEAKDGPVVTDQGFWIIDAHFPEGIADPTVVDQRLCARPGVLDHGLFLNLATDVLVGHPDGSVDHHSS